MPGCQEKTFGPDVYLHEEVDGPGVVQPGGEHHHEVVEQHGLEVQVELDGFVVQLNVGHLGRHGQGCKVTEYYSTPLVTITEFQ